MTDMTDIVDRLRFGQPNGFELAKAADEIERLRAAVHSCHEDCDRAGCVAQRLRAEVERLKAENAEKESTIEDMCAKEGKYLAALRMAKKDRAKLAAIEAQEPFARFMLDEVEGETKFVQTTDPGKGIPLYASQVADNAMLKEEEVRVMMKAAGICQSVIDRVKQDSIREAAGAEACWIAIHQAAERAKS